MTTTSVKVSELTGAALRYAVAVAAGYEVVRNAPVDFRARTAGPFSVKDTSTKPGDHKGGIYEESVPSFAPDLYWRQCGPLIEEHGVNLCRGDKNCEWLAYLTAGAAITWGDTPLIAACRAIGASYWGEYADIPSELVQEQSDE